MWGIMRIYLNVVRFQDKFFIHKLRFSSKQIWKRSLIKNWIACVVLLLSMEVWAVGSKSDVIQCYPSGCFKNNDKRALDLVSHVPPGLYSENSTAVTAIYTLCFAFKKKALDIIFQRQDRFTCDPQFRFNVWKAEVEIFDDYWRHLRCVWNNFVRSFFAVYFCRVVKLLWSKVQFWRQIMEILKLNTAQSQC